MLKHFHSTDPVITVLKTADLGSAGKLKAARLSLTMLALALCLTACQKEQAPPEPKAASAAPEATAAAPADQAANDAAAWDRLEDTDFGSTKPLASGHKGVVSGTTGGPAVGAGLEMLRRGGSAVDAALATSLGQIALAAGSWVSYAGLMTMVYYDAASGEVSTMNANFNTVLGEDDPRSIPWSPTPSGRTALVPGYMAGVEAAHQRFGKLPFADIFAPAIHYTENGQIVSPRLAAQIKGKKDVLSRLKESKKFITKENGEIYVEGDLFRQPATANTLRRVATNGAAYMYEGPWAKKFVAAVQADGGKMTMEDMQNYQVEWSTPLHLNFQGYDLYSSSESQYLLGVFNLLEASGLAGKGHYTESPEVFVGLHKMMRATGNLTRQIFGAGVTPDADWLDKAKGREIWQQVQASTFPLPPSSGGPVDKGYFPAGYTGHSDAVVAVDQWGNVAVLTHSINTGNWGTTGLIVDGITIPDAASYQQGNIALEGPGVKHWGGILPVIVLKDGKPVVAMSSIGGGLHSETVKVLANMLAWGYDVKAANDAPSLLLPRYLTQPDFGVLAAEGVLPGEFTPELLDGARTLGLAVDEVDPAASGGTIGFVVNLAMDPATGEYSGAASRFGSGRAEGY